MSDTNEFDLDRFKRFIKENEDTGLSVTKWWMDEAVKEIEKLRSHQGWDTENMKLTRKLETAEKVLLDSAEDISKLHEQIKQYEFHKTVCGDYNR